MIQDIGYTGDRIYRIQDIQDIGYTGYRIYRI